MEVVIHGVTTQNFVVKITDDAGREDEFDIASQLTIDERDLEREIRDAAASEHFWHQIAIDAEHAREKFEKTDYAQFIAHTEKYARYYLKGSGEKNPTGAAKENTAVLIFSKNADREEAAIVAHKGYSAEASLIGTKAKNLNEFQDDMYCYGPTYEDAQLHLLALKHKASRLKAVSNAFTTKTWSIKMLAAEERARMQSRL